WSLGSVVNVRNSKLGHQNRPLKELSGIGCNRLLGTGSKQTQYSSVPHTSYNDDEVTIL
ncbi:hypothetical protein AVEN_138882-1, partial [Araneus ventricosus]